jgi:hypothetical protein
MITDTYELQNKLQELQANTLPLIWEEAYPVLKNDVPKNLEDTLTAISRSDDRRLKQNAIEIIKSIVDIEVDCDPTVDISF